jgi:hypothetical protein
VLTIKQHNLTFACIPGACGPGEACFFMHIIFVERRPPPKGYWRLVGEWIRVLEWPDPAEKAFLVEQSNHEWVLNKFGRKLYRTLSSWPYGVADPHTLALHFANELIREYRNGAFDRPIVPNGWLTNWFIDNW